MIKRSITFHTERRRNNGILIEENVPIKCIVRFACTSMTLFTGHRIDLSKFDEKRQVVRNSCTNKAGEYASDINADLDRMKGIIQDIFQSYELKGIIPSPEEVRNEYKRITNKANHNSSDLIPRYKEFMETVSRTNAWSKETIKKHNVIFNTVLSWNKDASFDMLDENRIVSLISYMQKERGDRNTTIAKHISFFKQFLLWAEQKGYNRNTTFKTFKPKLKGSHFEFKGVIFLTWEELMKIYNAELKSPLDKVRDVFCFCCFTGLRYSDVYKLKKSDIVNEKINIVTQKDVDNITSADLLCFS